MLTAQVVHSTINSMDWKLQYDLEEKEELHIFCT